MVIAQASAAASTPADDPSSASTVNHAMSLASSSIHAAGPDLWGVRTEGAGRVLTSVVANVVVYRGDSGKGARLLRDDLMSHHAAIKPGARLQ